MNALFDSAALAIVAYAEVDGATGASTLTNSGVITSKNATLAGLYYVNLSTAAGQRSDRDLIFVQARNSTAGGPAFSIVLDENQITKMVQFRNGSTAVDTSFSILILRTVLPPPVGAPA